MQISLSKTEVMHVCNQGEVSHTKPEEAIKICKFKCTNVGCSRVFHNVHGAKCHAGKCRWRQYYLIDKLLDVRGEVGKREFLVQWAGYGREHNSWEPRKNIVPDYVTEFLKANGMYDHTWDKAARCPHCDKPCRSEFGVKVHLRFCEHGPEPQQNFKGTVADKQVKLNKMVASQKDKAKVLCEGAVRRKQAPEFIQV